MSDEKPMESTSDDLAKTKKPGDIQLDEQDLRQVSGGLGDIKGESQDDKHKDF